MTKDDDALARGGTKGFQESSGTAGLDAGHQGDRAETKNCAICRGQGTTFGHWAWHNFCRGELNPVALIQFIDRAAQVPEVQRIRQYIIGVTGMDTGAVYAALAKEQSWKAHGTNDK